ncbi:MAG: glycine cleavage system protein GcvH [Pirellulales bacterium]
MNPENLKYNESHEWVGLANENGKQIAVVGITAFAIEQLTDLVYMELPAIGAEVVQGQQFGEVESVKAVSPLYSPVTGKVVAVHSELADRLEKLADDPYDNGWMIKVEMAAGATIDNLLDFAAYQKQCQG